MTTLPQRRSRGFTLLELLVVLFVMAMLIGLASVSIGRGDGGLRVESERLLGVAELALEEAVLRDRPLGLRVVRLNGMEARYLYHWLIWDGRDWLPFAEQPYEPHLLPPELELRLLVDDLLVELPSQTGLQPPLGAVPQLVFGSSGEVGQFRLELQQGFEPPTRVIESAGLTDLRLDTVDA